MYKHLNWCLCYPGRLAPRAAAAAVRVGRFVWLLVFAAVCGAAPVLAAGAAHGGPQAKPEHVAAAANARAIPQHNAPHGPARWFGVVVQGIPPVFGRLLGLHARQGMLVEAVVSGSPAAKAGLIPGDLITAINGSALNSPLQLIVAANAKKAGAPMPCELRIMRAGHRQNIRIVPGVRPAAVAAALEKSRMVLPPRRLLLGPGIPMNVVGGGMQMAAPMAAAKTAQRVPMTLTRWIDIFGYEHVVIGYRGRRYIIEPGHLKLLPAPVAEMVRVLLAHGMIRLESPPTRKIKIAILKSRLKQLAAAAGVLRAQLAVLKRP